MIDFTIRQFAQACHATWYGPKELLDHKLQGVVLDSRKVKKGDLFIAVTGQNVDGHRFIPDVFSKGALCVLSQQELTNPAGPYLLVEDTLQALREAARVYRETLTIPVIGVTGSVGKTSTKEMIASVLEQKYHVLKTPGNFNNEIGLPLSIFMINPSHDAAVLEMGMNHFKEMHRLSQMARPTHCVFTNIGVAHLEHLGSRDGILKAKMEMLDYAASDAKIFINGDDDKLITMKHQALCYGLHKQHDVWADQLTNLGVDGIRCQVHTKEHHIEVTIPLPGRHMVYNALAATCVGLSLGLTLEQIKAGIESLKPLSGHGNILHTKQYTILDDCYNANPVSMRAMLDVLDYALTRKVAILGDMGELGASEKALHASVGEHLSHLHIDLLITIGSLSEAIHQAALQQAPKTRCLHFADKEQFLADCDKLLQTGDAILVKASHYMEFEEIVKHLST